MTQASYNRLSPEDKQKHDEYMTKYFAGTYYKKLIEKYMPQVNKMDKSHLAMVCCNGAYLFGMDHFAWKKLKEVGPELYHLQFIQEHGKPYNPEIYEEVGIMLQVLRVQD